MAYRYLSVETLECDNGGKEAHKVSMVREGSLNAEWADWEMKKDGGVFISKGPENPYGAPDEEIFSSTKCRDSRSK